MSDDQTLQRRVMDELAFEPMVDALHIGVTARAGVVTLHGHVESYAARREAERAARRVRGVKAVVQEIEVRLSSDQETSNDEIAARAMKLLEWDVVIPPNAVSVEVKSGMVTLKGEVDWAYQRGEAERDVQRLAGVKLVVNQIRVRPHARPEDVRAKIVAAFERTAERDANTVTVDVRDGKVILGGRVQSWIERDDALRAAWSVPGVGAVEDHILIARP